MMFAQEVASDNYFAHYIMVILIAMTCTDHLCVTGCAALPPHPTPANFAMTMGDLAVRSDQRTDACTLPLQVRQWSEVQIDGVVPLQDIFHDMPMLSTDDVESEALSVNDDDDGSVRPQAADALLPN
eukprot:gnl/TRDRNA2_/TRDRNA2_176320_c4_seq12.p1 gnl/TRDRNA2_/TRDRNA2_176320_c4~~gnl/TRDRNA2_/TRDRNA2_176320_c4_seq12.p1  ORF type:complete len:127 (+),score=12.42 gnl/TRDRNA2_/TRDRNA2_176320_c4_seq12:492-872(+)